MFVFYYSIVSVILIYHCAQGIAIDEQVHLAGRIWAGGLVKDAKDVTKYTLQLLLKLNCLHQVPIHISILNGSKDLVDAYKIQQMELCSGDDGLCDKCADFLVHEQDADLDIIFPNRIDRLAYLRDMQRAAMKKMHASAAETDTLQHNDYVLLMDLDLDKIPGVLEISGVIDLMSSSSTAGIICANGMSVAIRYPCYHLTQRHLDAPTGRPSRPEALYYRGTFGGKRLH